MSQSSTSVNLKMLDSVSHSLHSLTQTASSTELEPETPPLQLQQTPVQAQHLLASPMTATNDITTIPQDDPTAIAVLDHGSPDTSIDELESVTQETLENSDLINWTIFQELLMMDEDEEGFALSLIQTFIEQAGGIFKEIQDLLKEESEDNLIKLSSVGHYLKGSAAALGLQQVQNQCERIQNYGKKINFDEQATEDAKTVGDWYKSIDEAYGLARIYYEESNDLLAKYFDAEL